MTYLLMMTVCILLAKLWMNLVVLKIQTVTPYESVEQRNVRPSLASFTSAILNYFKNYFFVFFRIMFLRVWYQNVPLFRKLNFCFTEYN